VLTHSLENKWLHGQVTAMTGAALLDNYRLQIITQARHFCWWNVSDDMRRIGRWSFWSWFHV